MDCFSQRTKLDIFLEWVAHHIPSASSFFDQYLSFCVQQYINAVEYLHDHHVAHRDLKLDNIVLDGHKPPWIKVCDFGFAKNWDEEANMFTQVITAQRCFCFSRQQCGRCCSEPILPCRLGHPSTCAPSWLAPRTTRMATMLSRLISGHVVCCSSSCF